MRDIKFRGKLIDTNKWVFGYLFKTTKSNPLKEETCWILNDDGKFKVVPETVGQFIGHPDKNKWELYEGDIIHWNHLVFFSRTKEVREDVFAKVIWSHAGFTFEIISGHMRTLDMETAEVVGNILDNPELLLNTEKHNKQDV